MRRHILLHISQDTLLPNHANTRIYVNIRIMCSLVINFLAKTISNFVNYNLTKFKLL